MSTRAELARDEDQRKRSSAARKSAKAKTKASSGARKSRRIKTRTAAKATYAYEAPRAAKPSRKSTRKGANRSRSDAGSIVRESIQKGSPEAKFRRSRAKSTRTRGSAA
jgi:hypothetical protein